jgi:hypothetical protein
VIDQDGIGRWPYANVAIKNAAGIMTIGKQSTVAAISLRLLAGRYAGSRSAQSCRSAGRFDQALLHQDRARHFVSGNDQEPQPARDEHLAPIPVKPPGAK